MKKILALIDRKKILVLSGVFLLLTLISALLIIVIVTKKNRDAMNTLVDRLDREKKVLAESGNFDMKDFYLDSGNQDEGVIYPGREQKRYWSLEEVNKYWIDPSEAGMTTLKDDNDKKVFQSLGIPPPDGQEE